MAVRKVGSYVGWPPREELRALIDRAQHDDAGALERLLTALRRPLLAYFSTRVPDDTAEDLTQVALIRISRALPRIESDRAERYVSTVARNLFRSAHRRRVRDGHRYTQGGLVETAESPIALDLDVEYRGAGACDRAGVEHYPPGFAQRDRARPPQRGDTCRDRGTSAGKPGHDPHASSSRPGTSPVRTTGVSRFCAQARQRAGTTQLRGFSGAARTLAEMQGYLGVHHSTPDT